MRKGRMLKTFNGWFFWVALIALLSALVLTILSSLELCTSACVEGQKWRIFGAKFETLGLLTLPVIIISHILSAWLPLFRFLAGLMISGAIGAESWFIYIQKVYIGSFCPICLGIALCLGIAAGAYLTRFLNEPQSWKEDIMHSWRKTLPGTGALILGFLCAFLGAAKLDLQAADTTSLKDNISFGAPKSSIEIYIFTDWFCPACRKVDPEIEKMLPEVEKKAKVFFVDAAVHSESLNFTPYNLAFMINNKDNYLEVRKALQNLADKNKTPSEADIKNSLEPLNVTLKELNYSDVAVGVKLFKKLVKQFEITQTPTIVIVNTVTKKGKKFSGTSEITQNNVVSAIDSLQ